MYFKDVAIKHNVMFKLLMANFFFYKVFYEEILFACSCLLVHFNSFHMATILNSGVTVSSV